MQDRGLAAYIAELVGTMFLVFIITSSVVLYVAVGPQAQFGSDFAVVGLAQGLVLFVLIIGIGMASGGHFNPAVTVAAAALRRIEPIDALIYILAQLSGGVLGALLTKAFLLDEGRASDYGAVAPTALIGGSTQAAMLEALGAFLLVFVVIAVALNPKARQEWGPLAVGLTLAFIVMIIGPLTGAGVNPARWFGPALVGNEFADVWPYVIGPLVGALAAVAFFRFVIEPSTGAGAPAAGPAPTAPKPPPPSPGGGPAGPSPGGPGGGESPKPPSPPPGGIVGGG